MSEQRTHHVYFSAHGFQIPLSILKLPLDHYKLDLNFYDVLTSPWNSV